MKFHAPSRRLFLRGAGAALALPFLESLVPRTARAQSTARRVRYIQVQNPYGPTQGLFFGNRTTNNRVAPDLNTQRLTDIAGNISPIFGAEWNPFKSRMSLVRGIDVLARTANHHYCLTTCASSYAAGIDGDNHPPASGQASIDALLAASARVYDTTVPETRRLVTLNPVTTDDYSRTRSFSWKQASMGVAMVRPVKQTDAFYSLFSTGFGEGATTDPRETSLLAGVWDDFRAVRDGTRISAADKRRLDAYMGLITDISAGAAECSEPDRDDETGGIETIIDNQFRLLAAALACDLTRVASIILGMSEGYGVRHDEHHQLMGREQNGVVTGLRTDFINNGRRIARLATILDGIDEGEGTLFDNSILYYSMQYGILNYGGQHNTIDMALMVAGGGGGMLEQGHYIDYRKELGGGVDADNRRGLLINNLLVTFMNTMGLSSSDFELPGRRGYGDYPDNVTANPNRPNAAHWLTDAGKRSPLPFLYKGPVRG